MPARPSNSADFPRSFPFDPPAFYIETLTPEEEIRSRLNSFKEGLKAAGIPSALVMHNLGLCYLTGTMQTGFLFVPQDGEPVLWVKQDLGRARFESPLSNVRPIRSLKELPDLVRSEGHSISDGIGLEMDALPASTYLFLMSQWKLNKAADLTPILRDLRVVKSEWELQAMREAADMGVQVFAGIPEVLRPGVTETRVMGHVTATALASGSQVFTRAKGMNVEFTWQVISGINGTMQGHHDNVTSGLGLSPAWPADSSMKPIGVGEPIMIDFSTNSKGYQADESRMFSIGEPESRYLRAHEWLRQIEETLASRMRAGAPCEEIYFLALEEAEKGGYGNYLLGPRDRKLKYVGHGVGLESNEPPFLAAGVKTELKAGMTAALELKMVLDDAVIAFENTFLVGEDRAEKITKADEGFTIVSGR